MERAEVTRECEGIWPGRTVPAKQLLQEKEYAAREFPIRKTMEEAQFFRSMARLETVDPIVSLRRQDKTDRSADSGRPSADPRTR